MADRFNPALHPEVLKSLAPAMRSKRVAPDVSVLLAGLLDPGSYSNQTLALLSEGIVVLGSHVEDMALRVLRANAPNFVGDFADGLIQLSQHTELVRVPPSDRSTLPEWAARLSGEDQQVLAEAMSGAADVLLTHDSDLFFGQVPELRIESPSSFLWTGHDPRNVEVDRFSWTFVGLFWPHWGTKAMHRTPHEFHMFDLTGKAEAFYDTSRAAFVMRWYEGSVLGGELILPQVIEPMSTNFFAAAVDEGGVFMFANGETRQRDVRVGPVPARSNIYPFNNSRGGGQIDGAMRYRMIKGRLKEKRIRRLWRSRSLWLSDGELRFKDLVSTTRRSLEAGS